MLAGGVYGKAAAKLKDGMHIVEGGTDVAKIIKEGGELMRKNGDELAGASAKATKEGAEELASSMRGTGGEGYRIHDTGPHGELSPNTNRAPGNSTSGADGRVQSHHPVQQEWAKNNVVGYNANDAPTILLHTHAGASHAKNRQ